MEYVNRMNDKLIKLNKDKVNSRIFYHISKRVFDLLAASIGLVLSSPIMLVIAYKIRHEDHGPVFYKQIRVGKDGRRFKMYKFRSMVMNADQLLGQLKGQNEVRGAMFKMKNDPRITKVGHFIRRHSLDELPQFLNVIKGDMSLVGPRPSLPSEVAEYSEYDKQRLYVTPGCTGLWQATERNEVGFDEMVQLDLKYIKNASIGFDLWIILRTVKVVIKPNGSY